MGNLFLSFTIAISSAMGLVALSRVLDLELYINKILPLIPVFYAIVYEVLDRRKNGKAGKSGASLPREGVSPAADAEAGITPGRIVMDMAVSFFVKFSVEIFLVFLFLHYTGQTLTNVYGEFSLGTVGAFLRGEHPWLSGRQGVFLLALIAILSIVVTGSWIGRTSRGNAILEGVLAGAAVTLVNSMTNMLALYRTMEEMTVRLADSMGYVMRAAFLVVLGVQVLLYGLWSGVVQTQRQERMDKKKQKK